MNVSLAYGTHLPCLMKAVENTDGPMLELGTGIFSTPFLRYTAMLQDRKLVSYENFEPWYDFLLKYYEPNMNHEINFVEKYSDANLQPEHDSWDIVLIDQTPDSSRAEEAMRLKDLAKYIIVHDSNPSNYKVTGYDKLFPHFKYKIDWMGDNNRATVLSNIINLEDFWS